MFRRNFWIDGHLVEIWLTDAFDTIFYVNNKKFSWSLCDQREKALVERALSLLETELALPVL